MRRPGILSQQPSNGHAHADDIHGDDAYGDSRYEDISDSDLLALEAAVNSNNQIGPNHRSCRSNKGTPKRSPYASPPSQLVSLPAEIILEILRALPSDDKLRKVNRTPENWATLHRLPTRRTLVALSLTCRALRQLSQMQLFSEIYLTNGRPTALLLRSLIEEPHFCTYVRRLYLGYAVDHEHESRVGLRAIYERVDVNKIPRLHRGVLEECGIKDQWTERDSGVAVAETFETFVGLMLSLTTRLESLTLGFNERDRPYFGGELWESPSGIERFLSSFRRIRSLFSGNLTDASSLTACDISGKLLTNLRHLEVHGNINRSWPWATESCCRFPPFPLPSLLTLSTIKTFTSYSDSSQWMCLDEQTSATPMALEELSFYGEFKSGSALSYLLKRCSGLKKLEVVLQYPRLRYRNRSIQQLETARISTAISKSCPHLSTLTLRTKGNWRLFFEDEPDCFWLSNMAKLVDLRTDVPCLFKNPTDMATTVLSDRLPPNLVDLALYDMWYGDSRYQESVRVLGDSELLPLGKVNRIAEPFAEMLLRLCSSRLACNFPNLRKVAVQSPIFKIDTGFASNDLTMAFEAAGVRFEVIPFA